MIELESPQIEPVEEVGTYAKYEAGPLQAGYGVTLGNALRRVLLSSLEGAAVTSIQVRDVYQEFSTIPGVKEDVTQIVLNVKKLRLKSFATHPVQLRLIKSGAGSVTAADVAESADVEIVNPELVLMTLDTDDVTIEMDLTVERGVGYLGAERAEALPIGRRRGSRSSRRTCSTCRSRSWTCRCGRTTRSSATTSSRSVSSSSSRTTTCSECGTSARNRSTR